MQFYGLADGRRIDDVIFVVSAKRIADITKDDTPDSSVMSTDFICFAIIEQIVLDSGIHKQWTTIWSGKILEG